MRAAAGPYFRPVAQFVYLVVDDAAADEGALLQSAVAPIEQPAVLETIVEAYGRLFRERDAQAGVDRIKLVGEIGKRIARLRRSHAACQSACRRVGVT